MGLDTRAYNKATPEWKEAWVHRVNEVEHGRPVMFGLMWEPIGQKNYGLTRETEPYLWGREPVTVEDAPAFHQNGLEHLDWPKDHPLIGGMLSDNGDGPSFRGKAYDDYVEIVTGQSLYNCIDEPWEGDDLLLITIALEIAVDSPPNNGRDIERAEREALAQWFRVCVDNGLVVSGDA